MTRDDDYPEKDAAGITDEIQDYFDTMDERREYLLMRDIADAEEQRWRKARIVGWSILAAVAVLFLSWAVA